MCQHLMADLKPVPFQVGRAQADKKPDSLLISDAEATRFHSALSNGQEAENYLQPHCCGQQVMIPVSQVPHAVWVVDCSHKPRLRQRPAPSPQERSREPKWFQPLLYTLAGNASRFTAGRHV